MTAGGLLGAALEYAASGIAVFPCGQDKQPRTEHGFHDATTDEEQVRTWFLDAEERHVIIGATLPEGTIVVDIDPRNGGDETIRSLVREGKTFPTTKLARTGGGGWHRWYSAPDASTLRGSLGAGVDIKRPGRGYVILPPSVTQSPYRWVDDSEIEPAPVWLVEDLARPEPTQRIEIRNTTPIPPFMDGTTYGERALHLEIQQLRDARPGERNNALNRAAFSMGQLIAGGELRAEPVEARLMAAGLDLGLEPHEVEQTVRSGLDAGHESPRAAPEMQDRTEQREASPATILGDLRPPEETDHFWLDWEGEVVPDRYILSPILPRSAYVYVYGPAEASKSMVFVGLGAQASCRGFAVSVYSLENPPNVDRQRLQRLRPCRATFRLTNELVNLADPGQAMAMAERERGRDLVIIDTYSHAFAQRYDSGDGNARAIEFARVVRWLMRETGATFVVVDHTGFENQEEPRDASAKRQQVDVAIGMRKVGHWRRGQPARWTMHNYKAARFANPFDLSGSIVGNVGEDLHLEFDDMRELEWGQA